jgi:CTP-dependent riboflavin kinase
MPTVRGIVRSGGKQWSKLRPVFYAEVERVLGMKLHQGTINIELPDEVMANLGYRWWAVVPGFDQIDIDHNQNIGLIPCQVEGVSGVRVIPFNRDTGSPCGYRNAIEVCLSEKLPEEKVRPDVAKLEVAFL